MLHCADRSFYVGHTDDLEKRVGEHELGLIPGYTSLRRPVTLVWSEQFPSREEAREAENRLKGWGREKKLALIRGDWQRIADLAKGNKGLVRPSPEAAGSRQASTSTGKPGLERTSHFLHPHLDHLPSEPFALEAAVKGSGNQLRFRFRLTGPVELLRIPLPAEPARVDELWRHTCFEAFLMLSGGGYLELNFSPSGEWAAYRFDRYRAGMRNPPVAGPLVRAKRERHLLELSAAIDLPEDVQPNALNLAAVIEEKSGRKSYWALAHPPEGPPDFHHPACFVLELPPAPGA